MESYQGKQSGGYSTWMERVLLRSGSAIQQKHAYAWAFQREMVISSPAEKKLVGGLSRWWLSLSFLCFFVGWVSSCAATSLALLPSLPSKSTRVPMPF